MFTIPGFWQKSSAAIAFVKETPYSPGGKVAIKIGASVEAPRPLLRGEQEHLTSKPPSHPHSSLLKLDVNK
jgi:hypothetical protein